MNFLTKLFGTRSEKINAELSDGYCPNCWGDQEYDNLIRVKYKDKQIDVNNHSANYAFVQNFIVTYMKGIKLKSTIEGSECPTCYMKKNEK
ncbi:hypothetical protein [Tenacibaculum agarivorans]|uniref:hypothetical protein n=1 Tax=Tenacibaculum agarivorans TaxID=1908389 RepID=UPI00094B9CE6|nr:hypothetical protein [Tenacibaculum agarivorans]